MVNVAIEFLPQRLGEKVVTKMYISSGDFSFPDSNWTDFAAIVLNWWVKELTGQIEGNRVGEYLFMDGPFFFETELDGQGNMRMHFKERRLNKVDLIQSIEVNVDDFLKSLKQSVNIVLRECHRLKIENSDVRELELSYSKILAVARK